MGEAGNVLQKRIDDSLNLIVQYGGVDGAHHKQWLLDQVVRILSNKAYDVWLDVYSDGADGPDTYEWDTGIAP